MKTTIDVAWDCAGSFAGAAIVFLLIRLVPDPDMVAALTLTCLVAAAVELVSCGRQRSGYAGAIEQRLLERGAGPGQRTFYTLNRETRARLLSGDAVTDEGRRSVEPTPREDPVVEALRALRSGDAPRIRAALPLASTEPMLVGAVIPLLGRADLVDDVGMALRAHASRVAGQLADALVDPATPEVVRRRLPLVLDACASKRARDGLVEACPTRASRSGNAAAGHC